ncbi:MAG: hypothetical protein HDS37_04715 [Bacteroides sp.]|nr:hypothetical protein [Bacteroides sp.]
MTREQMEIQLRKLIAETNRLKRDNDTLKQQLNRFIEAFNTNKKKDDIFLERLNNNVTIQNEHIKRMFAKAAQDIEFLRGEISSLQPKSVPAVDYVRNNVSATVYPVRKYARFLDIALNSFRESELSTTAANSIFEIIVESPDSARFHLVTDEAMRRQLFSMLNHVVAPACNIIIDSQSPERIVDHTDGLLLKDGDNWTIRKKASVKLI